MYTRAALLDLHQRTHQTLAGLMHHCAAFSEEELSQELEGFGYASIRMQLHHMVGAEQYWIGVLRGLMLTDEAEADFESMQALMSFKARVAAVTVAYLESCSDEDLNRVRSVVTWGNKEVELAPATVLLRTQFHVFQHQGQVTAMARLLGRPVPAGLDFPIR